VGGPAAAASAAAAFTPVGAAAVRCVPCPGGTYGDTAGLATSACAGPCAAGYYCPPGSVSPTQIA